MTASTRIALDDGGSILLETTGPTGGPVQAGRVGDVVGELPRTVRAALAPITELARAARDQLREAGPATVQLEFGVDLSVQAGTMITKGEAACHLKVTLTWENAQSEPRPS